MYTLVDSNCYGLELLLNFMRIVLFDIIGTWLSTATASQRISRMAEVVEVLQSADRLRDDLKQLGESAQSLRDAFGGVMAPVDVATLGVSRLWLDFSTLGNIEPFERKETPLRVRNRTIAETMGRRIGGFSE